MHAKKFRDLREKVQRGPFVCDKEECSRSKLKDKYVSPHAYIEVHNKKEANFIVRTYCVPLQNGKVLGGTLLLVKSKNLFKDKWYIINRDGAKVEFDEELWFIINPETNGVIFPKKEFYRDNLYRF